MIVVHGRNDDRVPVSFSSRPYVGLESLEDGDRSQLRYIEVTNAEHFGTDLPGFDTRMVPLTLYHLRALDMMWEHLTAKAPLPESQVVRTTPRGGTLERKIVVIVRRIDVGRDRDFAPAALVPGLERNAVLFEVVLILFHSGSLPKALQSLSRAAMPETSPV